jgi:hypothetical protein
MRLAVFFVPSAFQVTAGFGDGGSAERYHPPGMRERIPDIPDAVQISSHLSSIYTECVANLYLCGKAGNRIVTIKQGGSIPFRQIDEL